jgi:hypothetical protein
MGKTLLLDPCEGASHINRDNISNLPGGVRKILRDAKRFNLIQMPSMGIAIEVPPP